MVVVAAFVLFASLFRVLFTLLAQATSLALTDPLSSRLDATSDDGA